MMTMGRRSSVCSPRVQRRERRRNMSLKGNIEAEALNGQIQKLLELRGYSAYEIALKNGFKGTEEEWLASLKADFDEEADEAKASIFSYVDETVIPGAVEEINEAKDAAKTELEETSKKEKGKMSLYASEVETKKNEALQAVDQAAVLYDRKEILVWENQSIDGDARSLTVNIAEGKYEAFRIMFCDLGSRIVGDIVLYIGDSGHIEFPDVIRDTTPKWDVQVNADSIVFSSGFAPDSTIPQPYKIYGKETQKYNISVEDLTGSSGTDLLWENASPGSVFPATSFIIPGAEAYTEFFVLCRLRTSSARYTLGGVIVKDVGSKVYLITGTAWAARNADAQTVEGGVKFSFSLASLYQCRTATLTVNYENYCIPYRIYGVKRKV